MKRIISNLIIYPLLLIPIIALSQENNTTTESKISSEELAMLVGDWEGTLIYLDYSSGKPFEMPANLKIEQGKNKYGLKIYNIFPNEPKANNKSKLVISKDGKLINGKPIISKKVNPNNEIEFIVEYSGKDGNENKKATIREIYILGNNSFINRKKVKFLDQTKWIKRNESIYQKK